MTDSCNWRIWLPAALLLLGVQQSASGNPGFDSSPRAYNVAGSHPLGENALSSKLLNADPKTKLSMDADGEMRISGGDDSSNTASFTVDLLAPVDICAIRMMTKDSSLAGNWNSKAAISASADGMNFTSLAEGISGNQLISKIWVEYKGFAFTYTNGGTAVICGTLEGKFLAKGARHLRIQFPKTGAGSFWKLGRLEVETGAGLVIAKAPESVELTPDMRSWEEAGEMKIDSPEQLRSGKWDGPRQLSGRLKLMADKGNIYIAADITKRGGAFNDQRGAEGNLKDSVELFLELRDLKNLSADFNALVPASKRQESGYEYHIILNPGDGRQKPQAWIAARNSGLGCLEMPRVRGRNGEEAAGAKIAVFNKEGGDGYLIEAAIPLDNFGKSSLASGMELGVDATINAEGANGQKAIQLAYHATQPVSGKPDEWGRASLFNADFSKAAIAKATITVDASTMKSYDGCTQIVRETFGAEADGGYGKHMLQAWNDESGCFGRSYFSFDKVYQRWRFPEMDGKSEEEKRALIFSEAYWDRLDMDKVTPLWAEIRHLAKAKPKHLFMLLWTRPWQFEGDPEFGSKPPKLTTEQEALIKGTPWEGFMKGILSSAGANDYSPSLCKDKELFAEIVVNIVKKLKAVLPEDTRISITLGNENNWLQMFSNKAILDDFFDSMRKHGNYEAGPVAASEWAKQHNILYRRVKSSYPDVMIGGPDVCRINFTDKTAGRTSWKDYVVPVIESADALDFFDYHYGVNRKSCQIFMEAANKCAQMKKGWKRLPSVDTEAGALIFDRNPGSLQQFKNGLINEREWFGWLRNPDLSYGWIPLDLSLYYDGFGQAKGAGMPRVMFSALRGSYVNCASDTSGVETVAACEGERLTCIALNDSGEWRKVEFKISSGVKTPFMELVAKSLSFDFKGEKIRYAATKPIPLKGTDGLSVELALPPFGTCALECALKGKSEMASVNLQNRHAGNDVLLEIEEGKAQSTTIKIPKSSLGQASKRYILRLGYEKNSQDSALVEVNGASTFILPVFAKADNWDRFALAEFELDGQTLKEENTLRFSLKAPGSPYSIITSSILVQDKVAAATPAAIEKLTLDANDPKWIVSEEESKNIPAWYMGKLANPAMRKACKVAAWSFDEIKDGMIIDSSGNGNNGKMLNGAALAEGVKGKALKLDGKGACVRVEDSKSLHFKKDADFAISIWMKLEKNAPGVLLKKGYDKSIGVVLDKGGYGNAFPDPAVRFEMTCPIFSFRRFARSAENLADSKWHHIVLMRDASEELTLVFVDGKFCGAGNGFLQEDMDGKEPLLIGAGNGAKVNDFFAASNPFEGLIDEVAIYDGLLSVDEMQSLEKERGL